MHSDPEQKGAKSNSRWVWKTGSDSEKNRLDSQHWYQQEQGLSRETVPLFNCVCRASGGACGLLHPAGWPAGRLPRAQGHVQEVQVISSLSSSLTLSNLLCRIRNRSDLKLFGSITLSYPDPQLLLRIQIQTVSGIIFFSLKDCFFLLLNINNFLNILKIASK